MNKDTITVVTSNANCAPNIILKNDNKFAILALLIQTQIDISRAAYNVHVFLLITVYFSNPTKYMCLQLLHL